VFEDLVLIVNNRKITDVYFNHTWKKFWWHRNVSCARQDTCEREEASCHGPLGPGRRGKRRRRSCRRGAWPAKQKAIF